MTLREFGAVLAGAYANTYHYTTGKQTGNYVVWQEYSGYRQPGSPLMIHNIQVDLFTRTEHDPALQNIKNALRDAGVAFEAPLTDYEPETKYIHHAIDCQIVDAI